MYALNGLMSNDSGWTNIEVGSSAEIHCGDDYIFRYYVGAAGVNATAEKKALTLLYTDSIVKAYKMFSMDDRLKESQTCMISTGTRMRQWLWMMHYTMLLS